MYKKNLALNNLQWFICQKNPIKPTVENSSTWSPFRNCCWHETGYDVLTESNISRENSTTDLQKRDQRLRRCVTFRWNYFEGDKVQLSWFESRSKKSQKESFKQVFHYFSKSPPPDINALVLMMFKHCNPITEENGILVLQKLFHSTFDHVIVSKMAIILVVFEFRKHEEVR